MDQVTEPTTPFVAQTKQHRKDLDEVLQRLKDDSGRRSPEESAKSGNTPTRASRERSLAVTKIEEAIMWLGMDLKAQNTPNPYPHSYDPTSPIIDPTADGLKL